MLREGFGDCEETVITLYALSLNSYYMTARDDFSGWLHGAQDPMIMNGRGNAFSNYDHADLTIM